MIAHAQLKYWYCSSRKSNPVAGKKSWAVNAPSSPLPEGLKEREEIKVSKREPGSLRFLVKNKEGRVFVLAPLNIDSGMEYLVNGNWLKESNAFVLDALERQLGELPQICSPNLVPDLQTAIEERAWRIKRWGQGHSSLLTGL